MTALSAFLRKTPGEALREYFDRPEIGLPTEFDWSVPEAELSRPLLGAIEKMSRVQRDRISNDAERVHALSDEPGQAAIYSVAEDPAFLDGLANPHARSLWMFLNAQDRFRHAEEVHFTEDRRRGRMWAGYMTDAGCGFGKGYAEALTIWREYLDRLNALRDRKGMAVIQIAHTDIKRFDSPKHEPYDRYVIKLQARASALLQEHSDVVLFANYRISVSKSDVGLNKKVTRALGSGARVMHTEERPAFLAKNRYGLPETLPLEWSEFLAAMPQSA